MKIVLSLLVFLCSLSVFAQTYHPHPVDLSKVSDRDILREMEYRGYSCGYEPQYEVEERILSIVCDPYTNMITTVLNPSGTVVASLKIFMSSNDRCDSEKSRILKATKGRITKDRAVAFCDPYTNLIKYSLGLNNINQIEKTFMSSSERCEKEANSFNSLFPSR